jgi:hypothetical protein
MAAIRKGKVRKSGSGIHVTGLRKEDFKIDEEVIVLKDTELEDLIGKIVDKKLKR